MGDEETPTVKDAESAAGPEDKGNSCIKALYWIPICGGFCAPTVSPEPTFLRHFSNEFTVPGAPRFMKISPVCEQAPCCVCCGKVGTGCATTRRRPVMLFAFSFSFVGFLLSFLALLGSSTDPSVVKAFCWARAKVTLPQGTVVTMSAGIRMRVDEVDCGSHRGAAGLCSAAAEQMGFASIGDQVFQKTRQWSDEGSCGVVQREVLPEAAPPARAEFAGVELRAACEACRAQASGSMTTAVLSMITQIPQMTTNLQRSTLFGDVNCQATMAVVTSVFGLASGLSSAYSFASGCWQNQPGEWDLDAGGLVSIRWGWGPGFSCMFLAVLLKVVDALCHACVKTPPQRWEKPSKDITEVADYMMLSCAPAQDSMEAKAAGADATEVS